MHITRYSCQILMKLNFLNRFSKKKIFKQNFMKLRPIVAEYFHADR
jgi:hypothetical protein